MKKYFSLFILLFCVICTTESQVVIPPSTLPEIGEIQTYTSFTYADDTSSYRVSGLSHAWAYDSLNIVGSVEEEFADIVGTPLADSFPDANMIVSITGFQSAAIRSDSTIDLIGLAINSFSAFGVEGKASFQEPFTYRKTPFTYGDSIHDAFSFSFQFPSSLIPGLDTFDLMIPFATLDSVRLRLNFKKTEVALGWGNLDLYGDSHDVLHVKVENMVESTIELGVSVFGNIIWIDASDFLGNFNLGQSSTSYKFLSPTSKLTILEFTEVRGFDGTLSTTGRISSAIVSGFFSQPEISKQYILSPNPSHDIVRLISTHESWTPVDIYITSTSGLVVRVINGYQFNDEISISDLPSGSYTMTVDSKKSAESHTLLIIK